MTHLHRSLTTDQSIGFDIAHKHTSVCFVQVGRTRKNVPDPGFEGGIVRGLPA